MEAILFIGIQASGKSTFYKERFIDTHLRLNLDMLRTRHRETLLFEACLVAKQPFVIDNTNLTRIDRQRYIAAARAARFRVVGYYFRTQLEVARSRNQARPAERSVPLPALLGAHKRLELPALHEGFDALYYVKSDPGGTFHVEEWNDDV